MSEIPTHWYVPFWNKPLANIKSIVYYSKRGGLGVIAKIREAHLAASAFKNDEHKR